MTLDDFLVALEKTPRDWYIKGLFIRRSDGKHYQCPIAAVAGVDGVAYPHRYAETIGLPVKLAGQIMEADACVTLHPELRAKLLKACGLEAA